VNKYFKNSFKTYYSLTTDKNFFQIFPGQLLVTMKPVMLSARGPVAALLLFLLTSSSATSASKASSASASSKTSRSHPHQEEHSTQNKATVYEAEYRLLHSHTEDKDGLESIR
jgi:hypothetical protein